MTVLKAAWNWLALEPHQRKGLRALQICLGAMILFRVSTETKFAAYLWGPNGIGQGSSAEFLHWGVARWADVVFSRDVGPVAVALVMGLGAAGLVSGWQTRLSTFAALVAFMFLEARLPELGDGGDNVTRLMLTYMLFALPAGAEPKRGALAVWLHNVAILAIGLQIATVYFTSGFMKANGPKWYNGTAMYLISQVEWFSHPAFRGLFVNTFVTTFTTYLTILYQVWFPVAVLTRFRLPWLVCGIALHAGIATFMGLICFSTAMLGLELFLVRDGEYTRLSAWLGRASASLSARLRHRLPQGLAARFEER